MSDKPKLAPGDAITISFAQYEALMAAANEFITTMQSVYSNDCTCKSCVRRRGIIAALCAAGIGLEDKT